MHKNKQSATFFSTLTTPIINIYVAYTPDVTANYNISNLLSGCINNTIDAFELSGVNVEVNIIHSSEISYTESNNDSLDIERFVGTNDGYMDGIHSLRNQYQADVCVLLVNSLNSNGRVQNGAVGASYSNAFSVVKASAAASFYSFAHELGHLFGNWHDNSTQTTPYQVGHGYDWNGRLNNVDHSYSTIMSIKPSWNPARYTRVSYFSNPNKYDQVNNPMGTTNWNNCTFVINDYAPAIEAFQPHYTTSGTISVNEWWRGNITVTGTVTVASGVTLTVEPGATISFASGASLTVTGTLNATGTSGSGITFTKSGANNWSGIQFNTGSSGNLDYCTLQYAGNGIYCYNSSPTIKHSTIDNNSGTGLYLNYYSSPILVGNNFRFNSSYGIRCESYSSPNLTDNGYPGSNVIRNNNSGGVLASYYSNPNLLGYMTYGNSVFDNTGYEIAASSNCSINARKVFWGTGPTFSATGGSSIDTTGALPNNTNGGRNIVADNSSSLSNQAISLKVVADDLSLALDKQKDKKYDEAILLFLEVFKNNKGVLLGKYALSKIEECYTQAGKKDYLDYSKREIKPQLKEGSETYVEALELEAHQMVNLGLYKEAIGTLQMILKKYTFNEAIEKNTLFSLGAFHNIFFGDKINSDKYFEELKQKYPNDDLVNQIEIIKGLGLAANSSVQGGDVVLPFEETSPVAKTTVSEDAITNYPNPFNPSTKISFTLKEGGKVSLKVYDVLGKEVANLADGVFETGKHEATFNGSNLASGIYFYRLVTPSATITKKMMLMK